MASSAGTMRGTPKGQGRGTMPAFANSPASNIPRPAFETHASSVQAQSEVGGGSTMSASRQKQTKKDDVNMMLLLVSSIH